MVRIGSVVLNVSNVDRAAKFWTEALGYVPGDYPAFLAPADGAGGRLHLDETDATHLDLWVDEGEDKETEAERLISLGARRVEWEYPEGADFVVLADTEGNLFCVIGD
jgi:catechol 2,3-dioxygenase-like lactoylglutathione lyase family enzyme